MLNWTHTTHLPADRPVGTTVETDAELVARAKLNRQAFAPLYAQYLNPVYRYCYRQLGNQAIAEDATSQVFYKALSGLQGFREGSFKSWLFTIAHNVVVDLVRQQRPGEPIEEAYGVKDQEPTPEESALAAEQHRALCLHLAKLPSDQRSVVELRLAGLTGGEIAQTLNRSLGSVKMLQFRAVTRLRELMEVKTAAERGREEARNG